MTMWVRVLVYVGIMMSSGATAGEFARDLDTLLVARSIHCEFFPSVRPADVAADPRGTPVLTSNRAGMRAPLPRLLAQRAGERATDATSPSAFLEAMAPTPELLLNFGGVNRAQTRAKVISTRAAGARDVSVVRTATAVHFVDYAAGVFSVTTVFACNERDRKNASGRCLAYGAANTRHFDGSVLWQPDPVFERFRAQANHGYCDTSFVSARR